MTISVSPNGRNFYETSTPANELLVATADGIVALSRSGAGAAWRESRRSLAGKHVGSIAVTPPAIFAGMHGGGVWASEDAGKSWERRDAGIEFDNIYALNFVQAGDELRIYAGTEPAHLYLSTDLGHHWTDLPALRDVPSIDSWTFPAEPHLGHVKTIAFDPRDPDTMYVGIEVGGAFKTTDGGKSFRELNEGGFYVDVHRLMVAPSRPDDIYMTTGRGLYHSSDAGTTWEKLRLPGTLEGELHEKQDGISYPDALVMLPNESDLMFTAGAASGPRAWRKNAGAYARVGRSHDAGRTWEYLAGGLQVTRANIEGMTMDVHPGGFALYAGTTDGEVFASEDEGEHWSTIAQGLAPVSKSGHYRGVRPDWEPVAAR